ncbi:MAG: glycosyltransferase family 4 protein [Patescibacteria group bacterium]
MKILMLTPYLPYPLLSGGQIRTYNLLKKLSSKHEVTLFALIKEESERQYVPELEKYCKKVKVFKRSKKPFTLKNIFKTAFSSYPFLVIRNYVTETIGAVQQELEKEEYDLIHAETFYMMPHIPKTKVPIILVEQTIEYLGYESYAKKIKWPIIKQLMQLDIRKIKRWEKYYWNSCSKLIVMSKDDKKFISKFLKDDKKIEVVANGVDTSWFADKSKKLPKAPTILFVGTFKWLPNVEAVSFLVEKVWPLIKSQIPSTKLWIVGNAPTKKVFEFQKKDSSITVTGGIPDIRDAFAGSHVLLAPVFSGKGTRYKILEAMAAKTPIVASNTAVEGLDLEHAKQVFTSDTAEGMAKFTVKLLQDTKKRKEFSKNGYKFVKDNYDWRFIAKKLDEVYQEFSKI